MNLRLCLIPYCNKIGDQELASIMLGAAAQLTPAAYKKISKKKILKHDDLSMYSGVIDELVELIKEAPQEIEKEEQDDIVGYQIEKVNQKIKLLSGKSLISFFEGKNFDSEKYNEDIKINIPDDTEFHELEEQFFINLELMLYEHQKLTGESSSYDDKDSSSSSCFIL
ncbi:MAG: hypothetical protein RCG15_01020 [Candidatus Rickettsia vulgarisii]